MKRRRITTTTRKKIVPLPPPLLLLPHPAASRYAVLPPLLPLRGFVQPPLRLTTEMATTAASAGGPAGPPPRLRARRQARAATRDDNEDYDHVGTEERATRCASGRRPATQLSTIAGRRATTKRAVDNKSKQQPTIAR